MDHPKTRYLYFHPQYSCRWSRYQPDCGRYCYLLRPRLEPFQRCPGDGPCSSTRSDAPSHRLPAHHERHYRRAYRSASPGEERCTSIHTAHPRLRLTTDLLGPRHRRGQQDPYRCRKAERDRPAVAQRGSAGEPRCQWWWRVFGGYRQATRRHRCFYRPVE